MRWILASLFVLGLVCALAAEERMGKQEGPIWGVDTEPLYIIPYDLRLQYPSKTDRELRLMLHEGQERMRRWGHDIAEGGRGKPKPQDEALRRPTAVPDPDGRKNVVDGPCEGLFWEPPGKNDTIFTIAVEPLGNNKGRYNIYHYSGGRWRHRGDAPVVMLPDRPR